MSDVRAQFDAAAVKAAWHAAANVLAILQGPSVESLDWPRLGPAPAYDRAAGPAAFAAFLRAGVDPLQGGETLFVWASARGWSGAPAENWRKIPRAWRCAYHAFAATLAALDAFFALEAETADAVRAARLAARRGPVPAAALAVPDDERTDGLIDDPLALVPWAPATTARGKGGV